MILYLHDWFVTVWSTHALCNFPTRDNYSFFVHISVFSYNHWNQNREQERERERESEREREREANETDDHFKLCFSRSFEYFLNSISTFVG